jgi:allantoate deiminase
MTSAAISFDGAALVDRLKALATCTDVPGEMTRLTLSPAHRQAAEMVRGWFAEAGLAVKMDALGSVVGRHATSRPEARTLLIGSHLDTVPNGGIYDGPLGVIVGLEVVARLAREGKTLPFHIEVIAFADEEGVRFPSALSSSRAMAGQFDPKVLDEKDDHGITRRDALMAFGVDPDRWSDVCREPSSLVGYLEVHIEQGHVLEAANEALGVVSAISGTSRGKLTFKGKAGHAGTIPMNLRQDALAAAAETIVAIEALALQTEGLLATVGVLTIPTAAVNVIPGEVAIIYDIRAKTDRERVRGVAQALGLAREIAERRNILIDIDMAYAAPAAVSDPALMDALASAIQAQGGKGLRLPSGAGHDAMSFRTTCPQAMLFVRCKGGVSHHPEEHAEPDDIARAAQALYETVLRLADAELNR